MFCKSCLSGMYANLLTDIPIFECRCGRTVKIKQEYLQKIIADRRVANKDNTLYERLIKK